MTIRSESQPARGLPKRKPGQLDRRFSPWRPPAHQNGLHEADSPAPIGLSTHHRMLGRLAAMRAQADAPTIIFEPVDTAVDDSPDSGRFSGNLREGTDYQTLSAEVGATAVADLRTYGDVRVGVPTPEQSFDWFASHTPPDPHFQ